MRSCVVQEHLAGLSRALSCLSVGIVGVAVHSAVMSMSTPSDLPGDWPAARMLSQHTWQCPLGLVVMVSVVFVANA